MTLYTGGCHGSDMKFFEEASKIGHKVIICSFKGHNLSLSNEQKGQTNISLLELNNESIKEADLILEEANKYLHRNTNSKNEYIKNLLRRNYLIVKNVDRVYAIGTITNGVINGGTAWGCYMYLIKDTLNTDSKDKGGKELYFYDQSEKCWFWYYFDNGIKYYKNVKVPKPYGNYAGIGTREVIDFPTGLF
jgi:hypothetical protein